MNLDKGTKIGIATIGVAGIILFVIFNGSLFISESPVVNGNVDRLLRKVYVSETIVEYDGSLRILFGGFDGVGEYGHIYGIFIVEETSSYGLHNLFHYRYCVARGYILPRYTTFNLGGYQFEVLDFNIEEQWIELEITKM